VKALGLKTYLLPDGEIVVSYFDSIQRKRVVKKFKEEVRATEFANSVRHKSETRSDDTIIGEKNVGVLLNVYLEKNPNSFLGKSGRLVREFGQAFALFNIHDLTDMRLRTFLAQQKTENDYAERSMLSMKSRLQGFFKFLVDNKVIEHSPLNKIKFDRGAPFERKPVILQEKIIADVIRKAKSHSAAFFYPILLLIRESAAKSSDISRLQWKNINFKTGIIELFNSPELQDRSFSMTEELMAALKRIERVSEFTFTGLDDRPLAQHVLIRELRRFQRRTNLPMTWALKDLRSSAAAHRLRRGMTITDLQKFLGHIRPYQTEQVYGYLRSVHGTKYLDKTAVQETESVS
jgi:integrase/recombinase XerD